MKPILCLVVFFGLVMPAGPQAGEANVGAVGAAIRAGAGEADGSGGEAVPCPVFQPESIKDIQEHRWILDSMGIRQSCVPERGDGL
jgi:hypothetical protein